MRKCFSLLLAYLLVMLPWLYSPTQAMAMQLPGWLLSSASLLILVFGVAHLRSAIGDLDSSDSHVEGSLRWHLVVAFLGATLINAVIGLLQAWGSLQSAAYGLVASAEMEAWGQLRQRNLFATLLAWGLIAALHGIGIRAQAPVLRKIEWGVWVGVLALLTGAIAATSSRTGLIHVLTVTALFWVLPGVWRIQRLMASAALLIFGAWSLFWPIIHSGRGISGVVQRLNRGSFEGRADLYANVLELVAQSPWAGYGWRSLAYVHYSTDFSGARFMEMLDNAHNLPLHLAVELGLPVALAFCSAVAWLIWRGKPWKETRADRQVAWGILMVIGIHSLVEYPLWYGPFFITTVLCVGILCADTWQRWLRNLSVAMQRAVRMGLGGLAAMLFLGTVFVAFDYHRASQIYLQPEQRSSWYAADPLGAAKKSVLFQSHAKFAELQITPLTRESAPRILELSSELVHWSPEPRIIEKLIESATMLQLEDVAAFHLRCFKRAYPMAYAAWAKGHQR